VLERLYESSPPDVETTDIREMIRLAGVGMLVKRMGRQGMIDLIRILPMSVTELLDDWFESDALKGILGASAVTHLRQGPRSGGTAFNLLHHHVGSPAGVFRSSRSNLKQVLAGMPGVEVRRGAEVARITVKAGRVSGVVLKSGEEIAASVVASSADPHRTLLGLLETGWLDPDFTLAVENVKFRGVAATVTLTLDKAAEFRTLVEAPSLNYLERAYDDAKYGRVSTKPWFEAHAEGNRLIIHAQYAPYEPADGGWTDARRNAFADAVVTRLYECVPGLRPRVVGRAIETPKDLEKRSGLTEGQAYQGEMTLDQILFMRPVAGWGHYRMPVDGLYLCGAGTHPGGAVAGASGWNAAREILRREK
jgi:phytoene dehydrogenase-like protein